MGEINISRAIITKRKEKGIKQEELAFRMGVSKAAVSKWEIGQSYPDISLLPRLASFFNISIDELMGYEPQLSKEDIHKLYIRLSADFASKPFDDVMAECREIIKKYYSCFPLLFQMGSLIVNNSVEFIDNDKKTDAMQEAKSLFIRVKTESDDPQLCRLALYMEAFCALMLGEPAQVTDLLEGDGNKLISPENLLARAYKMLGDEKKAKSVLQIGIYQHLISLFNELTDYLALCDGERFEMTYSRCVSVIKAFDLVNLHPSMPAVFYLTAAQKYAISGEKDKALKNLKRYADIVTGDIYPLKLKGDAYFNLLGEWIENLDLGDSLPRDEKAVRRSMAESVTKSPVFASLSDEAEFTAIADRLNKLQTGDNICTR